MKSSMWLWLLLVALGLSNLSGCFGPEPVKPLTDEQKKQVDDDMKKAIEQNKAQQGT